MCDFEGCGRVLYYGTGLCEPHYRQRRKGKPLKPIRYRSKPGVRQPHYIDGYVQVYLPEHANARTNGWVSQHVVVMADKIGRPVLPGENVHHINGDRADNRPENLELWNTSQPAGQRVEDKVQYAQEILSLYAPELLA